MPPVQHPDRNLRQLQILAMHANGLTRDQIAAELCLSPWTIVADFGRLKERFEAQNFAQALAVCLGLELLVIEDGIVVVPLTAYAVAA